MRLLILICIMMPLTALAAPNPFRTQDNTGAGIEPGSAQRVEAPVLESGGSVFDVLVRYQRKLNTALGARLRGLEEGGSGFLPIVLVVFFYGMLHALSPGHNKVLFSTWVIHSKKTMPHVLRTSVAGVFAHTFSAAMLVFLGWLILKQVVRTEGQLRYWLAILAGLTMMLVGAYLMLRFILDRARTHSHTHHSIRPGFIVFIMGLVPCPLSTMIMVFCISMGFVWEGLLLVLFFSLGMSVTFLVLAFLVWTLRERVLNLQRSRIVIVLNIVVPLLVSVFFLWSGLSVLVAA